jgi:hypothetical protein
MASNPLDNITSVMVTDSSGNIVSIPIDSIMATRSVTTTTTPQAVTPAAVKTSTSVTTNNTTSTVSLSIDADEDIVPRVNSTRDNLLNTIIYANESQVGFNTTSPLFEIDAMDCSLNIDNFNGSSGYKLNGFNLATYIYGGTKIFLGDKDNVPDISVPTLYLSKTVQTPALTYNQLLQVDPTGKVSVVTPFPIGSIPFSDGYKLVTDVNHLFWDDTNNRLGVLTSTPAYTLDVNGIARIQTSLITPIIGNTLGVAANNTWTFASNVNIPLVPVDASHAASKQYVDNTALTGLKLGAEVKTVATTNVGLSGLSAISGYTPTAGDRILVVGQSTQSANGVYEAASGGWTRATDSDSDAELRGYQYLITAGTYINARYGNTNQTTITVGVTAITYQTISAGESDPIFTASPSFAITNTNISNWGTAYNRSIVSSAFSGTSTQTLTLTKQDGGTLTSSFTFPVTSVFGRTGDVVLTSGDVSTALGYTPYNGAANSNGYISSINSGAVTSALGYTPVPTTRTLTINGVGYDLSADRSWTIAAGVTSFNTRNGAITLTSTDVTDALSYIPASRSTTITINGISFDLSANRTFTTVSTISASSANGISTSIANASTTPAISIGATTDNVQFGSIKVGTFTTPPANTSGNINASGTITAGGDIIGYSTSDERLKDNITVIDNAVDKISKLRGVTFSWTENAEEMYGLTGDDMGLIAQDVQRVAPLAVQQRESGYLAVRYEKIIGLLVAGMNEQEARIKELESKIK